MTDYGMTPVDPGELLGLLEKRVAQKAGLASSDHCFLSTFPDSVHMRMNWAERFVTIFPGRWPVWGGPVAGGGALLLDPPDALALTEPQTRLARTAFGFDATLMLTCFCRMSADQELKSTRRVREVSVGALAFAVKVLSAVQFWHQEDRESHVLTREPPRAEALDWQTHTVDDISWATAKIPYSLRFTCKLPL